MALSNYGELRASIASWAHRDDLTTEIVDFVTLCESDIAKDLEVSDQDTVSTINATGETVALPTRPLIIRGVELQTNPVVELIYRTPAQLSKVDQTVVGQPVYYSVIGSDIKLLPAPDNNYDIEVTYTQRYLGFSSDTDTNYVLANYPDIYLYGALAKLYAHIEDTEAQVKYETMYLSATERANAIEQQLKFPSGLRMSVSQRLP